jgi:calcium-binding protein CML
MAIQRSFGKRAKIVQELQEDFASADDDGDGRIDFAEFKSLLEDLNAGMSQTELSIGFREIDTDRDGRIDLQEFAAWWARD